MPLAFYIPPKNDQAFLQGGTFVFVGDDTVYAHYDPSTAAHAPMEKVLSVARSHLGTKAPAPVDGNEATLSA